MKSKGPKSYCISMGGLRFAPPAVEAEPKRRAAKKKAAAANEAVAVPVVAEAVPQLEIAAATVAEPVDQARAA